jgi:hypothetical protein
MSSHLLVLLTLLSLFWARIVQTQKTFAKCTEDYRWVSDLPVPQHRPRVVDRLVSQNDRHTIREVSPLAMWRPSYWQSVRGRVRSRLLKFLSTELRDVQQALLPGPSLPAYLTGVRRKEPTHRVSVAPSLGAFTPLAGLVRTKLRFRALYSSGLLSSNHVLIRVDGRGGHLTVRTRPLKGANRSSSK